MKVYENVTAIINELQSNMNPNKKPLKYQPGKDTIKISSEVAVAFVLTDNKGIITSVDLCFNNCLSKKYISRENLLVLKEKLKEYVGMKA